MKEHGIVGPSGLPVRSAPADMSNAELRNRADTMRALVALKKEQLNNSLTGLAQSLATSQYGNQDNISSFLPLFTSNIYAPLSVNFTLLSYLYKTHGVLQTLIDEPVEDAWRGGLELTSKELGSGIGELEDFIEEKGIWESFKFAQRWQRLYGGSGLIINAGQDPEKPLDEKDIAKGNLEFYDADRWEFSGTARSAEYFLFYGQHLDASRVLTFGGKRAPRLLRATLNGWGLSALEAVVEDFNIWLRGRNVLYEILDEAKIDVYSIKDYASTLLQPDGEATLRARIQATNQIKNFHNALILDREDEYKTQSNSFAGLAEVMRENRIGIACATRIPFSKLFGTAASGGIGNSNQDDLENYNGMTESTVREPSRQNVRKVLRLCQIACFGREYDISFKYRPMRVLSATETETIKTSVQRRYVELYDKRILDSQELGELLHKDELVPIQTKAQKGLLPLNPEIPTAEDMFAQKPGEGAEEAPEKKTEGGETDGQQRKTDDA
jgi:hypothetical protein